MTTTGANGLKDCVEGVVVRIDSHFPLVEYAGRKYRCTLRKKLKRGPRDTTHKICVGDRVLFLPPAHEQDICPIEEVLPRKTQLTRKAARHEGMSQALVANVDRLIVVVSAVAPELNPRLIDRVLVAGENGKLECVICVNKMDLVPRGKIEPLVAYYPAIGYKLIFTSALTGEGLDGFRDALKDKSSVIAGPSGVGKSTLLNAIQPGLKLTTREVSEVTGKGKHVTAFVQLIPLDFGGYVVDTPGIREFGLWDVTKSDLQDLFREMAPYIGQCKFHDCTHTHEPRCAVKAAVEEGKIPRLRHESYCAIFTSL
jgi:ribosome biogenesis GTPase